MLIGVTFAQETVGGTAETSPADEISPLEECLINTIVRDNLYVITLSRLALQRSGSADVRALAQTIINYHGQTGEALVWIARESGVAVTGNRPSELSEERAGILDQLDDLEGAAFDEVYLETLTGLHATAVAGLGQLPSVVTNPAMQFFVNSATPIIS